MTSTSVSDGKAGTPQQRDTRHTPTHSAPGSPLSSRSTRSSSVETPGQNTQIQGQATSHPELSPQGSITVPEEGVATTALHCGSWDSSEFLQRSSFSHVGSPLKNPPTATVAIKHPAQVISTLAQPLMVDTILEATAHALVHERPSLQAAAVGNSSPLCDSPFPRILSVDELSPHSYPTGGIPMTSEHAAGAQFGSPARHSGLGAATPLSPYSKTASTSSAYGPAGLTKSASCSSFGDSMKGKMAPPSDWLIPPSQSPTPCTTPSPETTPNGGLSANRLSAQRVALQSSLLRSHHVGFVDSRNLSPVSDDGRQESTSASMTLVLGSSPQDQRAVPLLATAHSALSNVPMQLREFTSICVEEQTTPQGKLYWGPEVVDDGPATGYPLPKALTASPGAMSMKVSPMEATRSYTQGNAETVSSTPTSAWNLPLRPKVLALHPPN